MIPTARCVDAVGFAVPDLDEALAFLCDVVGCVLVYRAGPFWDDEGDWMARHLGVDPALVLRTAMLRCGPTLNVELLEWSGGADALDDPPARAVPGAQHLAFYVDDLDHAAAYLAAVPGVRVLGRPTTTTGEPSAGERWVLAEAACGVVLKLVWRPERLPYERHTTARLAPPAGRWDAARGRGPREGGAPADAPDASGARPGRPDLRLMAAGVGRRGGGA